MKAIKFRNQFFTILCAGSLFMACSPEDGEDGAVGPQGIQGEQGPAGAEGPQGEQGEPGTANVIYSEWMDSELDNNIIATGSGFEVDAPDLTEDIINNGVILGFGKNIPLIGTPDVFQLPVISSSNQYSIRAEDPGILRFQVSSIDGSSVGTPLFEEYRYILIPGGQPASDNSSKTSQIDYTKMSYEDIMAHFDIIE
ncbi:hypothetical protein [Maribacter sp. 2210JD10-5]|uniref:hypothetical protein n=1 Tax=Maribacter sp. 2210JD10-5 TaxID=3386272 RepID=UPI0039BC6159